MQQNVRVASNFDQAEVRSLLEQLADARHVEMIFEDVEALASQIMSVTEGYKGLVGACLEVVSVSNSSGCLLS